MKHLVSVAMVFCGACVLSAGPGTQQLGPFPVVTGDGGSCGNTWANDTFERRYTVISNGGGNYTIREKDDGTFVTNMGPSPGACETTQHHGATVLAGISGNIHGSADFTVSSSTYNPRGCDANPSACSTRSGFVTAVFGPNVAINFTSFNFEYNSSDQSLAYHHWQDKSDQAVNDKFEGDIANQ